MIWRAALSARACAGVSLDALVSARQGAQDESVLRRQFDLDRGADEGFVAKHLQISMLLQQLSAHLQLSRIGRREREIERGRQEATQLIDRVLQLPAAAVEAGTRGLVRQQIAMRRPFADQHRLLVPPLALADQRHGDQFGIGANGGGSRAVIQRGDLPPTVVDQHIGLQAEVLKARYHRGGSP